MKYNFSEFEPKWQKKWEDKNVFTCEMDKNASKYYCLEMFPYPSGNIHMGHVRNYAIGDVISRFKLMNGFNVLHPIGWDAFGLPAENAAKQNNRHPYEWTHYNIGVMKAQLKRLGLSYDWTREIATCDPSYYRWEQQLFIRMWEKGMAYKKVSEVNWCDSCETVLANEQVEDGRCWRCSSTVTKKELEQWYLKITDYADELLESTYNMPGWPEKVLIMQRNWIGKSTGAEVDFDVVTPDGKVLDEKLKVFTTRPDTIYGATFMLIAPNHPDAGKFIKITGKDDGVGFIEEMLAEQAEDAANPQMANEDKEKKGFNTGMFCVNPATGGKIPVYIANYILMGYGTGAVMAVPAHDQRDFDFAKKYNLPIKQVIQKVDSDPAEIPEEAYAGDGVLVNSGDFNGLCVDEGKEKIVEFLEKQGKAKPAVTYRLRDWGISRQRYWGTPVPFIKCPVCGLVPVKDEDLPVVLPENVDFTAHGNPLDNVPEFVNTVCPKCSGSAKRDTDTMDTFMDSSWYFLRYCSPHYDKGMFEKEETEYWMPVNQYTGGIEHAVMHLLYSRYLTKVMRDMGYISFGEPFENLLTQGMVCKETYKCPVHGWLFPEEVKDGKCVHCGSAALIGRIEKMSKSKKNVVDPDELVKKYGADTIRLFSLFSAPPDKECEWSDTGVEGCYRFINRVYRLFMSNMELVADGNIQAVTEPSKSALTVETARYIHATVKKVTTDMDKFQFNTAVAAIMEYVNNLYIIQKKLGTEEEKSIFKGALITLMKLLAPFTPHLAEELWSSSGNQGFISRVLWPEYADAFIVQDSVTIVVQVNGKLRDELKMARGSSEEEAVSAALASEKVQFFMEGKEIVKKIYVPDKLVSLVVK